MSRIVHVADYGVGNLHSVARAIEKVGGEPRLTHDPDEIAAAQRLVLPGVGAFEPCVRNLRQAGLVEPIRAFVRTGRPFLGICVGMQLLFDYSLEFGRHEGLGLVAGHVSPIPPKDEAGMRKVPHIGWNPLLFGSGRNGWEGSLLDGLEPGRSSAYFVHSYSCIPDRPEHRLADADYGGYAICATVERDNVCGAQFHPEKSGEVGLRMLANFLAR